MLKKCKFEIKCGRNYTYIVYFNILTLKSNS